MQTPPGPEGSNGSVIGICRGHPGFSVLCFAAAPPGASDAPAAPTRSLARVSYQVIARKYRPQRFEDVVGQDHVTRTLGNAIRQQRIAHAYIFCGPRGTGKTTIARIFAKCLNCTDGPKADFPADDPRCQEIADGRSMDVLEIDGASNNGVEQVRELRETVKFAPASSKFKIYIIDEVHMLSTAAFNALLKTLEEPPAHVKFMFATTDPEKVIATILSRCQRFDLRRIPAKLIIKHLDAIAKQEGVAIDAAALHAIARGADGCMRDAESTLEQLISFCGEKIVEADVLSMFGLTARGQLNGLAGAMLAGDQTAILRGIDDLARNGKDLGRLLSDLLEHFRNLLIFKVSQGKADWLETTEAETDSLRTQADAADAPALGRMLEILTESEGRLKDALSRKILLEVTLLRASEARNAMSLDTVLRELNALRGGAPSAAPVVPSTRSSAAAPQARQTPPAPAAPARPSPPPRSAAEPPPPAPEAPAAPALRETQPVAAPPEEPAAPTVGTVTLKGPELQAVWTELLAALKAGKAFAHRYLSKAFPLSFEGGVLTVGFDDKSAEYIPLVDSAKTHGVLAGLLAERGHADCRVAFTQARRPEQPAGAATAMAAPAKAAPAEAGPAPAEAGAPADIAPDPLADFDPAKFKDDPEIKEALQVFKARIVQVIPPAKRTSA